MLSEMDRHISVPLEKEKNAYKFIRNNKGKNSNIKT
jgi:hypothetical protein